MAYDVDPGGRLDVRRIRFNDYYEQRDWSDCVATATDDAHAAHPADDAAETTAEPLLQTPRAGDQRH